jgi:hypothetical protein
MGATHVVPARSPESAARQREDGSWYAAVTWQDGRREEFGRFKSAGEVEVYIRDQLQVWLDAQREALPGR